MKNPLQEFTQENECYNESSWRDIRTRAARAGQSEGKIRGSWLLYHDLAAERFFEKGPIYVLRRAEKQWSKYLCMVHDPCFTIQRLMFLVPEDTQRNRLTSERARKRTRSLDLSRSPTPKRRRIESSVQKEELPVRKNEASYWKHESTSSHPQYLPTYGHRKYGSGDSYWRHRSPTPPTQRREVQTLDQDPSRSSSTVDRLSGREELFPESTVLDCLTVPDRIHPL
jgi:hypothetical protein